MIDCIKYFLFIVILISGCDTSSEPPTQPVSAPTDVSKALPDVNSSDSKSATVAVTEEQEKEIRALVEQLVFAQGDAENKPTISPGIANDSDEYRERFESCQTAFKKLSEFKELAFPILLEHLDDKRQSINFRNHYLDNSVGAACGWILVNQLQDMPEDYSEYGYQRTGSDGKGHPKPYYTGSPFDDAGGLREWLKENKNLSYREKQIKCLTWLLDEETAIGSPDTQSYIVNILPLEIRILEHKVELGEEVQPELERLRRIKQDRIAEDVVPEFCPF